MITRWISKPYKPFFLISAVTILISLTYYFYFPDSYFDISIGRYFSLSNYYAWFIFGSYTFVLGVIYYLSAQNNLKTRRWLLNTHFVFVLLFMVLFFMLSSFNTAWVREFTSARSFFSVLLVYGSLYLLDIVFLVSGLMLLVVNLLDQQRRK